MIHYTRVKIKEVNMYYVWGDLKDITILHSIFKITLKRLWILSCVHFDGYQVRGMHLYVGSSVQSFLIAQ